MELKPARKENNDENNFGAYLLFNRKCLLYLFVPTSSRSVVFKCSMNPSISQGDKIFSVL